jgi:geranylgeranyl reductase family protein
VSSASSCDVLIIGAGPAGAAAAHVLASAGVAVTIADQRAFPRDKVCGDALIRDSLDALAFLGLSAAVQREAWHGHELRLYAPDGAYVSLNGDLACLPRERFDQILFDAAVAAGATFVQGTATAPHLDGERIGGALFKDGSSEWRIEARYTLLATGANATILDAFGLPVEPKPDAVAGRAYYIASPDVVAEFSYLAIVYQRSWCPGYGWMFPGPNGRVNVGVGLFGRSAEHGRLHEFFADFIATFPPAARLVQHATLDREFRGAPIRSGLNREVFGRPGLLALGEAVASTYSATGEGIGKAMESGLLAAELVRDALNGRRSSSGLEQAYRRRFTRRYSSRYQASRVALKWARYPTLLNVLARRANRGTFVKEQLEGLLAERGNPAVLFSPSGLLTSLIR